MTQTLGFFYTLPFTSNLSVFFFIPMAIAYPVYAGYLFGTGIIGMLSNFYTGLGSLISSVQFAVLWVCLPVLFVAGLLFSIPNLFFGLLGGAIYYVLSFLVFGTSYWKSINLFSLADLLVNNFIKFAYNIYFSF